MDRLVNDGAPWRYVESRRLGFSRRTLKNAVADGVVRRQLRDVYLDARVPDDPASRARGAALVVPPGAVICRRSAAWLYGLDLYGPGETHQALDVECVVAHHRSRARRRGIRTVEAYFGIADVHMWHGLPVTTPVRTALDLARWTARPMALAALDAMCHAGLTNPGELCASVDRLRGHPGVVQARELVALVEPLTESVGESWLRLRIIDAGFPRPAAQVSICDASGREVYRIDLGYPRLRLGLEYDGEVHHSSRTDRAYDEARRSRLLSGFGWTVVGFHRGHVWGRHPYVENAVGELLGQEPRLPRRW